MELETELDALVYHALELGKIVKRVACGNKPNKVTVTVGGFEALGGWEGNKIAIEIRDDTVRAMLGNTSTGQSTLNEIVCRIQKRHRVVYERTRAGDLYYEA